MKVWLELSPEEGERLFDTVKEFAVDRKQPTVVVKTRPVKAEDNADKQVTLEQVRAALAEKSQSGKQPEVKALITKYGAKKLTDIDSSQYKALLAEAETL